MSKNHPISVVTLRTVPRRSRRQCKIIVRCSKVVTRTCRSCFTNLSNVNLPPENDRTWPAADSYRWSMAEAQPRYVFRSHCHRLCLHVTSSSWRANRCAECRERSCGRSSRTGNIWRSWRRSLARRARHWVACNSSGRGHNAALRPSSSSRRSDWWGPASGNIWRRTRSRWRSPWCGQGYDVGCRSAIASVVGWRARRWPVWC